MPKISHCEEINRLKKLLGNGNEYDNKAMSEIFIKDLKEQSQKQIKEQNKTVKKAHEQCYKEYGNDLDACSQQQNEGCGKCRIAIEVNYK
jgi:hypothetical protein